MKQFILIIFGAILIATSCTIGHRRGADNIELAEQAIAEGRYARAQALCDSLATGEEFARLNTGQLCRLAMLFMQLADRNAEDVNTAFAARSLGAAFSRDSDSTVIYIESLQPEDRARVMILRALNHAQHSAPLDEEEGDSIDSDHIHLQIPLER